MNRREILFGVSAIAALPAALLPTDAVSQQKTTLKDQIVGVWLVQEADNTGPDGTKRRLYGARPKGQYIFDASGRFSLMIVDSEIPKFKASDRLGGTPAEDKSVMRGTAASFGTWSVDEADRTILMHIEEHLFPNLRGGEQKRKVESLTADEMRLTNPESSGGGTTATVLRRASASAGKDVAPSR